jgi:Spx/MgsR family transcriptional regulator
MIKVYGISNCNTVKKAIVWLQQNNLAFDFHDYKKKGITHEKLQEWVKQFGWENILNKKGTTWVKLSDVEKLHINNEATAIDYLAENTSAIKRPVIEADGKYLMRFDEKQYGDALI